MSTDVRGAAFDRSEFQDALMSDSRIAATTTSTFCGGLRGHGRFLLSQSFIELTDRMGQSFSERMELRAFQQRCANDQRVLMIGFCQGPFVGSEGVVSGNMWQCGEQCGDEDAENWVDEVMDIMRRKEGGCLGPGFAIHRHELDGLGL
eukprot:3652558-Ditylum_brightwellii.AAC.1